MAINAPPSRGNGAGNALGMASTVMSMFGGKGKTKAEKEATPDPDDAVPAENLQDTSNIASADTSKLDSGYEVADKQKTPLGTVGSIVGSIYGGPIGGAIGGQLGKSGGGDPGQLNAMKRRSKLYQA